MTLYPPTKPSLDIENQLWMDLEEEEDIQPLLKIGRDMTFKIQTKDDTICNLISEPSSIAKRDYQIMDSTLRE